MMQQMLLAQGKKDPTAAYVGGATGVNSATLPTHSVGDLIVCFAFHDGASTPPTTGAGFTDIDSQAISGSNGTKLAYRIATVTNTASGTWTNATSTVFLIYSGAAIGTFSVNNANASATVTYPNLSPSIPDGSSLLVGFAGYTTGDTSLQTPPTGMTNRQTVAHAGDEVAAHESTEGRFLWGAQNVAVGGTLGDWTAYMLEIKSA